MKLFGIFALLLLVIFAGFYDVRGDNIERRLTGDFRGIINSRDVEVWTQETHWDGTRWVPVPDMGGVEMIVNSDGTFSASWDRTFNSLFRIGRKFQRNTRLASIGEISIAYNAPVFTSDDTSYLGIYGWTRSPLIEWYIIDNWHSNWRPGGSVGSAREGYTHHGTFDIDGCTYDIITGWRINQPSIDGNRTFLQIYSVRHTTRTSGTIDVSAHFDQWAAMEEVTAFADARELFEVSFLVEGFGGLDLSSGQAEVDYLCIRYGNNAICTKNACDNCTAPVQTPTPTPTPTPHVIPYVPVLTQIMRFAIDETQYINRGESFTLEAAPFIEGGRTMVPLRALAEGLGAAVDWNEAANTVRLMSGGLTAEFHIGVPMINDMGTPVIVEGRTFIPLRAASEVLMLGAEIRWDGIGRAVYVYAYIDTP
jgi:endo-1,4-beta-xylanase